MTSPPPDTGFDAVVEPSMSGAMESEPVSDLPTVFSDDTVPGLHWPQPMRYPNTYVWFVFLSAMDIVLTWMILSRGGSEVNPLARLIIEFWDLPGAVVFKFSLMLFVIIACEACGRTYDHVGRWLAYTAVTVSALPVVYSLGLLLYHKFVIHTPANAYFV